jgi:hypothetical protein
MERVHNISQMKKERVAQQKTSTVKFHWLTCHRQSKPSSKSKIFGVGPSKDIRLGCTNSELLGIYGFTQDLVLFIIPPSSDSSVV